MGCILVILGLIFMICTIAVPVSMVVNPAGDNCVPVGSNGKPLDNLNRAEQLFCLVPDTDEDYKAETNGDKGYAKMYVGDIDDLTVVQRPYVWLDYQVSLKGSYDYFSFSVPNYVFGTLEVRCGKDNVRGEKCGKVIMYLVGSAEFESSVDSAGEFHMSKCTDRVDCWKGFDEEEQYNFTFSATGPDTFYLVFALEKNKNTMLAYDITLLYNVYDTSSLDAESCSSKGECKWKGKDLKKDKSLLIIDYPDPYPELGGGCDYNNKGSAPEYFTGKIHNLDINWSGVAAAAVIFALLTLVCFGLAALFLYKFLKKIGKLGKKVAKKVEKMEEKREAQAAASVSMQPVAAPVQPVYVDPNMQAGYPAGQPQPYPGQPYPGQPYPGQPYPGQM